MSISGGSPISAQVQLDLGQLKAQVDQAAVLTDKLGTSLKAIPSPKLDAQPLTHSAAEVQGVVDSLQGAFGKLSAPHSVGLDASSLKTAGSAIDPILKGLTGGMVSLGAAAAVTSTSLVALAVGATAAVLQLGEAYDRSFRLLQARTGETGVALEETRTALANLSATSPRSIEQLTAVFIPLTQILSQTADETATTTSQILKFARATGTDAAQAAGDLARLFTAFGVSVAEQPKFLDGLTVAMQKTGVSEQVLVAGLREAGPILRQFGLSASESTAFVAQLSSAGVEVGEVLRGLRTALGNVGGDQAKQQLTDLFTLLGDTGVDKTTRLNLAIANFGARTGPTLLDLAEHGKLDMTVLAGAIDDSAGAADRAAGTMKTSFDRIGALIEIGKKQWAPYGLAAVEGMNTAAGAVLDGLGSIGKNIDAFLASPSAKAFVTYLQATGRAGQAGTGPQPATQFDTAPGQQVPIAPQVRSPQPVAAPDDATQKALDDELERRGQVLKLVTDAEGNLTAATEQATAAEAKRVVTLDELTAGLPKQSNGLIDYGKSIDTVIQANANLVPELLRRQQVQDELAKGTAQLTDLDVKAAALMLEHAAASKTGAEQQALLAQASDLVKAHLTAQTNTQEQATEAQRKAETEVKAIEEGLRKAADEGGKLYNDRLNELATAVLPTLSAAETVHLKQMQDTGNQQGVLALLVAKTGQSETALTATLGATTAEFDQQKAAINGVAQAHEILAQGPATELNKRLDELANAAMPALTIAAQVQVKALQAAGDHYGAAAAAAGQAQVDIKDFGDISAQTADQFAASIQKVSNAAKTLDLGKLTDTENEGRIKGSFDALLGGLSAADAAMEKYRAGLNGTDDTLRNLLDRFTQSPAKSDLLVDGLKAGGAAAFDAQEKIKALITYVRDQSGQVRLKIDVDIEQVTHQISQIQQSFQESSGDLARAETTATANQAKSVAQIESTFATAQSTYQTQMAGLRSARDESQATYAAAVAKADGTFIQTTSKINQAFIDSIDKHTQAVQDAQAKIDQTYADAQVKYTEATQNLAEQNRKAIDQVTKATVAALHQLASAMQSFNDQQNQLAAQQSATNQNNQLAKYGFTDAQSQQSAQRTQEIQQAGQAGLQQVAAQNQLNQAKVSAAGSVTDAQKQAQDALHEISKQQVKADEAYNKTLDTADREYDKTVRNADQADAKTQRGLRQQSDAADLERDRAVSQAAGAEYRKRLELEEQERKANKTFLEAKEKHDLDLAEAQRQAAEQEAQRLEAQRKADKQYNDQLRVAQQQKDALETIRDAIRSPQENQAGADGTFNQALAGLPTAIADAVAAKLQLGPQTITQAIQNVNETGVDFADYLGASLLRRVRAGVV